MWGGMLQRRKRTESEQTPREAFVWTAKPIVAGGLVAFYDCDHRQRLSRVISFKTIKGAVPEQFAHFDFGALAT
jgi:hypothetical protein